MDDGQQQDAPKGSQVPPAVALRRMTVGDIERAVAVLREHDRDQDAEEWAARLGRDVAAADKYPVVAVAGHAVLGYARTLPVQPDSESPADAAPGGYYLLGLVVATAHRRSGLGRLLTEDRLRWLATRGVDSAYYYTNRDNVASERLHEQCGFRRVMERFSFPSLLDDHREVLYELRLPSLSATGVR